MTVPAWLNSDGSIRLTSAFERAGFQISFVGGCVRNWVLERPVSDFDLATSATPDQMLSLAADEGLKAIPTGVDHGTVTFVVSGVPYEVTTFRRDVETDGRHAKVAFSTSLREDAQRRDFTMNALYLDSSGTVSDPLNGLNDAKAGCVRFIGSPQDRIVEDALRILRFFRFYAHYGDPNHGIDAEGLAACAANWALLEPISTERVSSEMLKLLSARNPAPAVASMASSGGLTGLIEGSDPRFLTPLVHMEDVIGLAPNPLRRLAILGGETSRLRFSRKQSTELSDFSEGLSSQTPLHELAYRKGASVAQSVMALRAAQFETLPTDAEHELIKTGTSAVFPLKSEHLMPALSGAALGNELKRQEARWIASLFSLSLEDMVG